MTATIAADILAQAIDDVTMPPRLIMRRTSPARARVVGLPMLACPMQKLLLT
jgi:hypothetical protein